MYPFFYCYIVKPALIASEKLQHFKWFIFYWNFNKSNLNDEKLKNYNHYWVLSAFFIEKYFIN